MRIFFSFIASLFFLSAFSQKKASRNIIDVHLHARLFNDYGDPPSPNPLTGKKPQYTNDKEVAAMTLDTLRKYNVVYAIASGSLSRIIDFKQADTTRLIPSLEYPDRQGHPLQDTVSFVKLFNEKKFSVFGELGLQYEGKVLTDPELEPYLAICERLEIPVALHTGLAAPNSPYTCCPKFRTHLGNPQLIEEVLVKVF